jgi:hypothetical protein
MRFHIIFSAYLHIPFGIFRRIFMRFSAFYREVPRVSYCTSFHKKYRRSFKKKEARGGKNVFQNAAANGARNPVADFFAETKTKTRTLLKVAADFCPNIRGKDTRPPPRTVCRRVR